MSEPGLPTRFLLADRGRFDLACLGRSASVRSFRYVTGDLVDVGLSARPCPSTTCPGSDHTENRKIQREDFNVNSTAVELDPPLRVMSLHALAYCQRLFYLEEVEEIRVADDRVYAGRELHTSLEADEEGEQTQLELADPELGLFGKVDAIRRRDGSLLPYEHKRGRCRRGDNGPEAWPSDRLQVVAYAALIASTTGEPVAEGRVRYHADNVTVRVPFDDAAREELAEAIATARRLRQTTERPPVTDNERLCVRCSLAPVCLPEEVRQAEQPDHEPLRLFPPDRDGTSLHVLTHGASIGRSKAELVVRTTDDAPATKHPIRELDSVVLHGYAQMTTQAINLCIDHDVAVMHWLTASGRHVASLTATAGQVQRRVRQYRALADETICLRLARALVRGKVEGQHRYLLRGSRGDAEGRDAMLPDLVPLRSRLWCRSEMPLDRGFIRGLEGLGRRRLLPRPRPADQPDRSRNSPLFQTEPSAAHGPVQRDFELWLRPFAHVRDTGDPGCRPRAIPWFSSHAQERRLPVGPRRHGAFPRTSLGYGRDRFAQPRPVGP